MQTSPHEPASASAPAPAADCAHAPFSGPSAARPPAVRRSGRASGRTRENGFTLVEILVVLAILALAATLVVGRGLPGGHLVRQAALDAFLRDARSAAIARGRPVAVALEPGPRLVAEGLPAFAFARDDVVRATFGGPALVFAPDGSSAGGRIAVLPRKGAGFGVVVAPVTGAIGALH